MNAGPERNLHKAGAKHSTWMERLVVGGVLLSLIAILVACLVWLHADPPLNSESSSDARDPSSVLESLPEFVSSELGKVLHSRTWTWEHEGVSPRFIRFAKDRIFLHPYFEATYSVVSPTEIAIKPINGPGEVTLSFDSAAQQFSGLDFDGRRRIWGRRLETSAAAGELPFEEHLCNALWTWNRLKKDGEKIRFLKDGSAKHTFFSAGWKLHGERTVVLTFPDGRTVNMVFDADGSGWIGVDLDGKTPIWGGVALPPEHAPSR